MKNTKAKIISIVYMVLFLVLLALSTYYVTRTLKDKGNYLKYVPFYEEEEQFDVLFFGSSRMLDGVHPMELWDEYGLTSYNMAQHSETTRISYWQLENAIKYNKPKVAVVDLFLLDTQKIDMDNADARSYLHKSLDHIPFSKLKYDALMDLTDGVDIWEYMCPFAMYHNRWNDLDRNDIYMELPCRKGAESRVAIEVMQGVEWATDEISTSVDTEKTKLDAIIALCEENDVQLVFTCMPAVGMSGNADMCKTMNYIQVYANEHGIPFLNFAKDDDAINYALDFHDSSHLNPSGAKKITNEIGAFLVENYTFDAKSDRTVSEWQQAKKDYLGAKLGELIIEQDAGNPTYYLMLLNDNDYVVEVKMQDISYVEEFGIGDVLTELGIQEENIIIEPIENSMEVNVILKETGELFHSAQFNK